MSVASDPLYHPVTAQPVPTWKGFSWPCLLFGVFWFTYKGMYLWALGALVVSVVTGGFAWLAFPFFANNMHRTWLRQAGYLPRDATAGPMARCPECRELVRPDARKCKHCGSAIEPAMTQA